MTLYVNITNTCTTKARTGIQRVVREVVPRIDFEEIEFLAWEDEHFARVQPGTSPGAPPLTENFILGEAVYLDDIGRGDIFLDLDASWGDRYDIAQLFLHLKSNGVLLLKMHFDAVPVLFPEFSHENTVFAYLENISASLQYVDYWLCISNTVEKDLHRISRSVDLGTPVTRVIPLGADFHVEAAENDPVSSLNVPARFLLCVGTVEPRKNYDLVLDMFDKLESRQPDLHLVIAGKQGWNVTGLANRISGHKLFGKRIHWLKTASDAEVDALYRQALITLVFSHYEGYGLPVIEALTRHCVTLCGRGGALEEVARGAAYCVNLDPEAATAAVLHLLEPKVHADYKDRAKRFELPSWTNTGKVISRFLHDLQCRDDLGFTPRQAVYISIRDDSLMRSLQSVARHMEFIEEAVVLTSDKMYASICNACEQLPIPCRIISEGELGITELPDDHVERNTYLRTQLYQLEQIDPNFIAFDDDYLAIRKVRASDFMEFGVHKAHYFFEDGREWLGAYLQGTSFDLGIWRTARFLHSCGYDTRLYNSHMPQIVNKSVAGIVLQRLSGLGLDEWSSYFNIAKHLYPDNFKDTPYRAMGWPPPEAPWLPHALPDAGNILFMNYYANEPVSALEHPPAVDDLVSRWSESWQRKAAVQLAVHPGVASVTVSPEALSIDCDEISSPPEASIFIGIRVNTPEFFLTFRYSGQDMVFDESTVIRYMRIPAVLFRKNHDDCIDIELADSKGVILDRLSVPVILTGSES